MKLKVVAIILSILLISLLFFIGFKKISPNKSKAQSTNIEQLDILRYLPEDNKLLFISNLNISNIVNNIEKDKNPNNEDNLIIIKDAILNYLGIDLGNNKLEDIYNNELIISTSENNKNLKDDILIIFKIKPEKNLDDILHLSNQVDQIKKIIPIYRENKISYLNFIYRTEDNYIIASSDKKLIINCINSSDDIKEKKFQSKIEVLGLENQKNILFTKKFEKSIFYNNEIFPKNNEDSVVTTFALKNKYLVLQSYLLNNRKDLDILKYDELITQKNTNKDNSKVLIFSNFKGIAKFLKPLINDLERSIFEEFNQNILILNSNKDWIITYEKNSEDQFDLGIIKKLNDFNKFTLKKDENIYSVYSKNILAEKDDLITKLPHDDIYSLETSDLLILSNHFIDSKKLDLISKEFSNQKSNKDKSAFIYTKVDVKDKNYNNFEYFSSLDDLNFLIKNLLKVSNEEFLEIVKQSIPEKNPILYTETTYKLFE